MRIYHHWRDLPPAARGATVALGNFDGVHLGHAHVLRAARLAHPDTPLAAITFEPHPREIFRPNDLPFRLTLAPSRADALAALGVEILYEMPFDAAFSQMTADAFVSEVLCRGVGARHLAAGSSFVFGYRRAGDTAFLGARAEALGMGLTVVTPFGDGGGPISSSRIRHALREGYPDRAAEMLGRPWAVRGTVLRGDARGRSLGFPTANLALGRQLEPARGVYAVIAALPDGRRLPGVANIGRRPTVDSASETRLEVHLFDFAEDLYGQELEVALVAFQRPERRFGGLDALRSQITIDAAEARRRLDLAAPPSA
jgi:riboflavin kinase/FMN adenylyltransferase